jgi:signal peptide peptidase SppA
MGLSLSWPPWRRGPIVPALRMSGIIGSVGWRGSGLTLSSVERMIERAFAYKQAPAVALIINSPGGSPVQSSQIASRIRQLADEKHRPVLTFVEDLAASGGYWLACAGDEIFVDRSSIVGSIGVITAGFGFAEAIQRLGVERRVHTTGPNKGMLDPFRPERDEDLLMLREIQSVIYESFKAHVRGRRAGRLKSEDDSLFDGRIWAGSDAVDLGLADAIGDPRTVIRARFGPEARLVTLSRPRPWLQRRLGFAAEDVVAGLGAAIEERALWSRYGL